MAGVNGEDDNPQASQTLHPGGTALQGPKDPQEGYRATASASVSDTSS